MKNTISKKLLSLFTSLMLVFSMAVLIPNDIYAIHVEAAYIIEGQKVVYVEAGDAGKHNACITENGCLYTWGNNKNGRLGDGTTEDKFYPVKIMDNVAQVQLGLFSGCITKDSSLYTWGYNEFGELGNGTTEDSYSPVKIMDNVAQICLFNYNSACITKDGSLYTWGWNKYGQIGDGTYSYYISEDNRLDNDKRIPVKIMDNVVQVSLGGNHAACVTKDGSLYTWGSNYYGQLGFGNCNQKTTPLKLMSNVSYVSLGVSNSACITKDGSLYTWGYNGNGELGDGTSENKYYPEKIMDNVAQVYLQEDYSACITKDGSLYTWGSNYYGQLGDGTKENKYYPVKILDNVAQVSLGTDHAAFITKDGSLYTCGNNVYGQLGDGTRNNKYTPEKILDNVTQVSIAFTGFWSGNHSVCITKDGSLYAWGDNDYGQLGDGTTDDKYVPTKIIIPKDSDNIFNLSNEDAYIQEHIDFINKNSNYLKSFSKSSIFEQTNHAALLDEEVLKYKFDSSIRDALDGKFNINDITNSQFIAQTLITELLCSEEFNDNLTEASLRAQNKAQDNMLSFISQNRNYFNLTKEDLNTIESLIHAENKSDSNYIYSRDSFINKIYENDSTISLSTLLDIADGLDIPYADKLGIGFDILESAASTIKDIQTFYQNSYSYAAVCGEFRDALDIFEKQMYVQLYSESEEAQYEHSISASRNAQFADDVITYIEKVKNNSDSKFLEYSAEHTFDFMRSASSELIAFGFTNIVDDVLIVACPEVAAIAKALNVTLHIYIDLWEDLTDIDERAFERDLVLNYAVAYRAISDAFGTGTGTYCELVLKNKDIYSVNVFEKGLGIYKKIATLYKNHAVRYYQYWLVDKNKASIMADYILDPNELEEINKSWSAIDRNQKKIKAVHEQIYVNQELLKVDYISLISVKCHENNYVPAPKVKKTKFYYVACPVNVVVSNVDGKVAEIIEDNLEVFVDDPNVMINVLKNDEDAASKALVVPYDYTVTISGYADGSMDVEKMVMDNGEIIDSASFENIPVSEGLYFKEVLDGNSLIAINGYYGNDTEKFSIGDVNTDGKINVTDIVKVAAHVKGKKLLSLEAQKLSDVNKDGKINVTDIVKIAAHVKGKVLLPNSDNNTQDDENDSNDGEYAVILYDKEYGRWYVEDDDGNALPLTCTYDPDKEIWYTSNGKELNVVHSDNVKNPNYELPDKVAYLVLPNGEAMQLSNIGYLNTIYNEIDGHKVSAIGYRFNTPWVYCGNYGLIDPNNNDSGIKLTIPDNITYCGSASMLTWGLNELQLSDSLLCIEDSAFMVYDGTSLNDTTFNDLKLNDGLKYIGDKAFFGYSALTSVRIPSSVNHIGDYAFGYYTDIEKLQEYYQEHIGDEDYELKSPEKFYKKIEDFTIYGKKGTEAERYAEANGFSFIDNNEVLPDLISLNETSLTLDEGSSAQLTATISPDNAKDKSITWSSSDTSVATVSNGKVTAISEGKTTITANTTNGKTASCSITVKEIQPSSITLNKTSLTLDEGSSAQLTATISPDNAKDKSVTWSSSDTSVATVSNGKVTAISEGKVTISVKTVNNKTAFCSLTVRKPQEEYIKIYTANDFNNIRNNLSGKYVLMNDIDLTGFESWVPIGDAQNGFNGVIDGNNHTVTYQINESASAYPSSSIVSFYYGLIGYAHMNSWYDLIEIKNLNVCGSINTNISSYDVSTQFIGGLVGRAEKINIRNCCSNVVVNTKSYIDTEEISVTSYVGGIIGWSDGCNIENCINNEKIDSKLKTGYSGCHNCGGICGVAANSTIINNCENYGEIRVSTDSKIIKNNQWYNVSANGGGIAGSCGGGAVIIENCYSNCHLEGYIKYPDDTIAWVSLAGIAAYGEVASYAGCSSNCSYNYNEDTYLLPNGSGNYNVKRAVNELIGPEAFYNSDEGWTA